MIITTNITMDLSRRGPTQVISAVQDDRYSRNIAMALTCGGVAWEPPEGTTVQVRYRKPDGTGGNYDTLPDGAAAWSIDGSTLTVALAPQVCTVPGRVTLTATLVQGETQLHTFVVDIDVQPNPGLQATSENYYKIAGALPDSGWEPDRYLGTDGEGKVVTKTAPAGGLTLLGTVRPGQYLRVESVDENGNITVEAVDLDAKAAVAYLYNGVRLPKLPKWDKTKCPYCALAYYESSNLYRLYLSAKPAYVYDAILYDQISFASSKLDGTYDETGGHVELDNETLTWGEVWIAENAVQNAPASCVFWTNNDIYYEDDYDDPETLAGTLYLAASDPVPIYE